MRVHFPKASNVSTVALNWRFAMQKAVDGKISKNAQALLDYLSETSGKAIITGQHTQTNPMEELTYIKECTGYYPKLVGFELLSYSPNINYNDASEACLTEIYENQNTLDRAYEMGIGDSGVIITFSFHWFSPIGGRDKAFYTEHTMFDATRILIENTPERMAFYHDMDVIAGELQRFYEADIPILWRPFHESDGKWFWWGAKGPEVASELYKLMYDYFVNVKGLHNLLWVWNCRLTEGYLGDEYVDVISVDLYMDKFSQTDYKTDYELLISQTTKNKVVALAEVGYIPDVELLSQSRVPWVYYMCWSKEFCIGEQYNSVEHLKKMYNSDYSIKLVDYK